MKLLHGETIQVRTLDIGSEDEGGNIVTSFSDPAPVDDVLVAPGPCADITDSERPNGAKIQWTCYLPKAFTDDLRGAQVSVRGGDWLDVVGVPGAYPDALTPGDWNRIAEIGTVVG